MKSLLWGLSVSLLLAACHKADLPPNIHEPVVFSVILESDSLSDNSITAGLDDYYLFTSFDRDQHDVVTMRGAFADRHCPSADCPETLTFEFRNTQPGAVIELNSGVVENGSLAYAEPAGDDPVSFAHLGFLTNPAPSSGNYSWLVYQQGELVAGSQDPGFEKNFTDFSPLQIQLDYTSDNGFHSVSTSNYSFNLNENCPTVSILAESLDSSSFPGTYSLRALIANSGPVTYQWSNNSMDSTTTVDSVVMASAYSVTVVNSGGCSASAQVSNLPAGNNLYEISPRAEINRVDSVIVSDPLQLGRVAIQWIAKDGTVWRSDRSAQPGTSHFLVHESAFYDPNENGEKTAWMRVDFLCWLFNTDGEGRLFKGQGTIGVAYP